MKHLLLLVLVAASAAAQEATLNSTVTRTAVAKVKIAAFAFDAEAGTVALRLRYQDSSNENIQNPDELGLRTKLAIPSAAGQPCTSATTLNGMAGAMNVTRASETGANGRIQLFRVLGYLADQGCLTGVTLVP